jgi:hypothetical protein
MKDPAFLFYSADFLSGVSDLTMEERGQYITMLCLQQQKGTLSEKTIRLSVGSVSVDVMKKFIRDENGDFYNARLAIEIKKRTQYTESRRLNGKKGGRPKKPYVEPTKNHTGNRDVNETIDKIEFEEVWVSYGKKGNRKTSEQKWGRIKVQDRDLIREHIPRYVSSTPDKQYRKNFETYLSQQCWNDEVVEQHKTSTDRSAVKHPAANYSNDKTFEKW